MMQPTVPNPMSIREQVTEGPVPQFDQTTQLPLPNQRQPLTAGAVLNHGNQFYVVTDISETDPAIESELELFNQTTRAVRTLSVEKVLEMHENPLAETQLYTGILTPADATTAMPDPQARSLRSFPSA